MTNERPAQITIFKNKNKPVADSIVMP